MSKREFETKVDNFNDHYEINNQPRQVLIITFKSRFPGFIKIHGFMNYICNKARSKLCTYCQNSHSI